MNSILLVTLPNHDLTTNYISSWAQKALEIAKKKSIKTVSLKGKRDNRKEFESIIKKISPKLVFLNGHGDVNAIAGQNNEILIQTSENETCLSNKIIYALSCRSEKVLGKASVDRGAIAYIGYDEDFIFNYDRNKISQPLEDKITKLFLDPSNMIVISLLKNHTVQASCRKSQDDFKRKAISLITSKDKVAINTYLPNLLWDMQHQVCLGNKKASFI